ncbi:hypothetical protein MCEMAEM4_00590 [Burkholderiaceae bacterium]
MKKFLKFTGIFLITLIALVAAAVLWATSRLAKDDPNITRPSYKQFEMGQGAADGTPKPSAVGYVVDSAGRGRIVPPMPPEKPKDIHNAANQKSNLALRSCFWPGPRARNGVFTNDANSFSLENQFPDTGTTYIPTALKLPEGAKLVVQGDFPHMRHWNFNTYNPRGEPQDALNDVEIVPDAGSVNPFLPGVARDAKNRRYTFTIVNGKPATPRPANTLYTFADAGKEIFLWMRNYVPDHSSDYLGSVALPSVSLVTADGQRLEGDAACEASNTPMRGKQLPSSVDGRAWVLLTHLPWVDTANVGAKDVEARPLQAFFNRKQVVTDLFFPLLTAKQPEQIGGWWSNKVTRYGYTYLSRNYGQVYVMTAKMPRTPKNWNGEKDNPSDYDMRYASVCTGGSLTAASTPDCIYDEQLVASADDTGRYALVISRQEDRPSNANAQCGVAWIDIGNGDGMVSGSPQFASLINRHTQVHADFKHSWFAVTQPGTEKEAMGEYLPYVLNLKARDRFEALGCPVDKSKLWAMLPK